MPPIAGPNHTQIPNSVLDSMHTMSGAEFKVVSAICRKTFGWQKRQDVLSISQLIELTGLSRPTVVEGITDALEHGWITREKHGLSFRYSVNISNQLENLTSKETLPVLVKKLYQSDGETSKEIEPTKESIKETTKESRDSGSFSAVIQAYEVAMGGTLSARMSDEIQDAINDYGGEFVVDAIHEAEKSNSRSWRYVLGILKNWKKNGRRDTPPPTPAPPTRPAVFVPNSEILRK